MQQGINIKEQKVVLLANLALAFHHIGKSKESLKAMYEAEQIEEDNQKVK